MSTNESAPKRDRLLVKLDDLQNYNNADHAKRDAFRREFAKKAFGAKSNALIDKGSDEQVSKTLDGVFGKDGKMTRDQQQHHYNLGTGQKDGFGESAVSAPAVVESPESASLRERTESARRSLEATPEAPTVAPESNPADATAAPAPELDANGHAGFTDTNDERAGVGARAWAARTNATANVGGYFARRRAALDQKYAEQRERVAHLPEDEREKQLNKINRNEKIRRFAGRAALFIAGAATATGLYLGARYGLGLIGGGNHEQAQDAATGSGSGNSEAYKGHPSTNAADHADQLRINEAQEFFNTGLDTTKLPGKNHINDFGTPSGHGFEGNKEGMMSDWSTLLRGNSRTMSTYLSEFDMGGVRGKPSAAELSDPAILAQYHQDLENHAKWLDANPVEHKRIYDELMATLGSAKIGELETYPGSYGSWYVNHETGEAMWDSVVNYDNVQYRTITLGDGREYNINPDCFLQISEANAVVTPQGGGYQAPQGGGGGNHYYTPTPEKPVYPEGGDNPPTGGNPPTENPPTENPPTENPPTENPPTENPPTGGEEPDKNPALSHRNDGGYTGNAGDLFSVDPNDFSNVDPTPTDPVRVDPAPVINNLLDGLNNGGSGGNFNTSTGDGKAVTPGTTSGDLLSGGGVGTADPSPNTSGGSSDTPRNSSGAVGE